MNRQAKLKGSSQWTDMGAVTLSDAAVKFVEQQNLVSDTTVVIVRDNPDPTEYELTVTQQRAFKVSGLRGKDE